MRRAFGWAAARWAVLLIAAMYFLGAGLVLFLVGDAYALASFVVAGPLVGWLACANEDRERRREAFANLRAANRYVDDMKSRGLRVLP